MNDTHTSLVAYATLWWQAVFPEYRDEPLTILSRQDTPDQWHLIERTAGAHTLGARDFSFVVDFEPWTSAGPGTRANFLALAAHELTHVLLARSRPPRDIPADQPEETPEEIASYDRLYSYVTASIEPWFEHEVDFIRLLCHAVHRSVLRIFPMRILAAGEQYGLSPAGEYYRLLLDECEALRRIPIADVAKMPVPQTCQQLFDADCQRWRAEHPHDPALFDEYFGKRVG